MTDCAITTTTTVPRPRAARSSTRRARPYGVPWWAALLGVVVLPLSGRDEAGEHPDTPRAWLVSAGGGPGPVAAVFVDDPGQPGPSPRSEERSTA